MGDTLLGYGLSLPALAAGVELALRVVAIASGIFTIGFSFAAVYAARRFRRSAAPASEVEPGGRPSPPRLGSCVPGGGARAYLPAVTVLKPIKGIDRGMYGSLASFLRQRYPRFQILFAVQDPEDPALAVLERLRQDFPAVDMEIVVSRNRIGYNPKVNNLSNAAPFVKHEVLVISDSDVRVEPDFLRRAVAPLADPSVGMVSCFYRSPKAPGLGSLLEASNINTQFLPQALAAGLLLGLRFAMGAAMIVRRDAFEAIGGFSALSEHLADDFVLGNAVAAAGWRLEFSDVLVETVPERYSVAEHVAHVSRASRTIRICQPVGYAGMGALHGLAFLTLHMALFGPCAATAALWLATAAARVGAAAWMHLAYLSNPEITAQLPLIPLSDLIQFAAWVSGFQSRTVLWRGEYYHIHLGGRLVPRDRKASVAIATTGS